MNKIKVLVPKYVMDFHCIGDQCEDTCCKNWCIDIDEKTLKKYKECNDKKIRDKFLKNINKYVSKNGKIYSKIVLNSDGICPFLSDEKLCGIQKLLGEEYLSNTCKEYPRIWNFIDGQLEKTLTLSCPEVAKLVLLDDKAVNFVKTEAIDNKGNIKVAFNSNSKQWKNTVAQYFSQLRDFSISIIKNDKYELWEGLIILGLFLSKIQKYINEDNITQISSVVDNYKKMVSNGSFDNILIKIPTVTTLQMEILKELADERYFEGINNERYYECYSEFLRGIKYISKLSIEQIANNYNIAYKNYYKPFMDKRKYILKNYVINYMLQRVFPMVGKDCLFDNYVQLIINYSLIKMLLIGMAGFHKEDFNEKHVVKLIQSFVKVYEHNIKVLEHIYDLIKNNKMDSMAYMSILIKN